MGKLTVFHGSNVEVAQPRIVLGRYTKDFGPGFYCTMIREQAQRWACRKVPAVLNIYQMRAPDGLDVLEFSDMTDEWLDFIAACRAGVPHAHGVVVGPMADDQVYNYVADFLEGAISRDQFWTMARFRYPTHQVAFCSDPALGLLDFLGSERL